MSRSCQDLQGFSKFLLRSFKTVKDLGKKMKGLWRSWQENERSLKILARKWKILEYLNKNFEDIYSKEFWRYLFQRFFKDLHEDPYQDPERSPWRSPRILKDPSNIFTGVVCFEPSFPIANILKGLCFLAKIFKDILFSC